MSEEVILWMDKCVPERLVANRVMLVARNIFILENSRDFFVDEYNDILECSGSAGIVRR